jgi:hypothetical protein
MYRTLTFLSLLYSLGTALNAQDIETHEYFQIETNKMAYAFGDNINVRDAPNTTGKVVTQIKAGTTLKILDVAGDKLALKGIEVPWVKVQFLQNGKNQQGYIWSGLLALDRVVRDGCEFLLSLTRIEGEVYYQEVRVVKEGNLLASKEYKSFAEEGFEVGFEVTDNKGVAGVKNIIKVHNGYAACGYWSGYSLFFWDNKQLFFIGNDYGLVDGGEYYKGTKYIFPADDKELEGKIKKKDTHFEADLIGNSEEKIISTIWVWDGKQLVHKKEE